MYTFDKELEKTEYELTEVKKVCDRLGRIKLAFFLILAVLFFYNIENAQVILWYIVGLLAVVFFALLWIHSKKINERDYLKAKKHVLDNYILRARGEWKEFENNGAEFLSEEGYVEVDLDILGEKSLYQYLCVANTSHGKKKLANYLTQKKPSIKEIQKRAEAVEELVENTDFRIEFESLGYLSQSEVKAREDDWFYNFINASFSTKCDWLYSLLGFFPLIALAGLVIFFFSNIGMLVLAGALGTELVLAYCVSVRFGREINCTENFCRGLDSIVKMVECIYSEKFNSAMLKELQAEMNIQADMITGIRKLSKINEGFATRKNVYVHVLLQMFLMIDLQYVNRLRHWKKNYGKNFEQLFQIIGEVEAVLSLGVLGLNHEVSYPKLLESEKPVFEATDLYHPLIDNTKAVANSIQVTKGVNIITGSNMSGKSTFMRTVGINTVLAFAGAAVCARDMKVSVMELLTCMRVTDDVFTGKSSFYAEVLRIKTIIDTSRGEKPILVLIDEIFKGTNSIDRVAGAKEIVKQLDKSNVMLWVSTHDLEICSLIEDGVVQGNNYHFLEHYENKKLLFDYKIKSGKCISRNAEYIIKMTIGDGYQ